MPGRGVQDGVDIHIGQVVLSGSVAGLDDPSSRIPELATLGEDVLFLYRRLGPRAAVPNKDPRAGIPVRFSAENHILPVIPRSGLRVFLGVAIDLEVDIRHGLRPHLHDKKRHEE